MRGRIVPPLLILLLVIAATLPHAYRQMMPEAAPARETSGSILPPEALKPSPFASPTHTPLVSDSPALTSQAPIASFKTWLDNYELSTAATRLTLLPSGEALAQQRREQMFALIASDPEAALAAAVPESQRRLLPAHFSAWLEQPIAGRGDLALVAGRAARGHSTQRGSWREARLGDTTLEAFVYGQRAKRTTLYGASVGGIALGGRMAVLDAAAQVIPPSEVPHGSALEPTVRLGDHAIAAASEATEAPVVVADGRYFPTCCAAHAVSLAARWQQAEQHSSGPYVQAASGGNANTPTDPSILPNQRAHVEGTKTVLVIIADFSDAPGRPNDFAYKIDPPIDEPYVQTRLGTQGGPWMRDASYDKTNIGTITVTPLLRVGGKLSVYASTNNHTGLKNAALAAAMTAGFTPANHDRVVVVFRNTDVFFSNPNLNPFFWAGLADVGGTFVWCNGYFDPETIYHELIHNMGVLHANLWAVPANSSAINPAGYSTEYGDIFDIMGNSATDVLVNQDPPNPWFLQTLGWLPSAAVQIPATSGTYRVYRFDSRSANLANTLALRVPRNHTTDYWLSYRRKYAGDLSPTDTMLGATVTWGYHQIQASNLIDVDTPGTNPFDAALNVGKTLNDTTSGISFTVLSNGGTAPNEYLDIQVNYSPRLAFSQPTYNVDEKSGNAVLTVERLSNATGAVTANYTTVNGTALATSDYTTTKGTLHWPSGDMTPRRITVPIKADALAEGSTARAETFIVRLSSIIGAALPSGSDATVRLHEPGATDASFVPPLLTNSVDAIVVEPDENIVIGGNFDLSPDTGVASDGIAHLNSIGTFDDAYDQSDGPNVLPITTMQRQLDGRVIVAGNFTSLRGVTRNRIARLHPNGTLDTSFDAGLGPDAAIRSLVIQPDGKILVGGTFTTWAGEARPALVRLDENGALDTTFAAFSSVVSAVGTDLSVHALALQPVATAPHFAILAGGTFQRTPTTTAFRSGIVRLLADGTLDSSFDALQGAHLAGFTNNLRPVSSLAVQADGKILVGGQFTAFNGVAAGRFARLNNNGSNDSAFITATKGAFTTSTAATYGDIVGLWPRADGKIIAVGTFTKASGTALTGAACYSATGVRDATFKVSIGTASGVKSLAIQPDNALLLGLNGSHPNALRRVFSGVAVQAGSLAFSSAGTSAAEGGNAHVLVRRTGGSGGAISVNFQTLPGTATAGTDFTTTSGTLTWAAGDTAPKTISLPLTSDSDVEGSETFSLALAIPLGGTQLGTTTTCTVTILDGNASAYPTVDFTAATSSISEGANNPAAIEVRLSAPSPAIVRVPFVLSGSALLDKDYMHGATYVDFAPGETSQFIPITPHDDFTIDTTTPSVVITLETPFSGAQLGSLTQHSLAITDDEQRAQIQVQPIAQTVALGGAAAVSIGVTGVPTPTFQWYRNNLAISGATSASYPLPAAQLSQAGSYKVTVTNLGVTLTSASVELAVADMTPSVRALNLGTSTTLSLAAAGNGLTYRWQKNATPLTESTHTKGTATKALTISTLTSADSGDYRCLVTSSKGAAAVFAMPVQIGVIDTIPAVMPLASMPPATVGLDYASNSFFLPIDPAPSRKPTSYTATGLPPGLSIVATTGQIIGSPTVPLTADTTYNVTLNAINFKGTASLNTSVTISPLPAGIIGSYSGWVGRNPSLNSDFGGRIDFDVTLSSAFSGNLRLGTTTTAFTGMISLAPGSLVPSANFLIPRTSKTPLRIIFTIDVPTATLQQGSISDSAVATTTAAITGWRATFSATAPANEYEGYYTFGAFYPINHSGFYETPQGTSYGSIDVTANGTYTITGRLAEGTSFTQTGDLGPSGEMLIFDMLGSNTGSLLGALKIVLGTAPSYTDNQLSGPISWSRKAQTTGPNLYRAAFYHGYYDMPVRGGRYIDPATISSTALVMNLADTPNNARLLFYGNTGERFPATLSPTILQRVLLGGALQQPVVSPNPHNISLAINPSTGAFNGELTIVSPPAGFPTTGGPRTADFQGTIINDGTRQYGVGYFLMPMYNVYWTATNTRIYSNPVFFEANP